MTLTPFVEQCQARVNAALEQWLPAATLHPRKLHEAMRYAALGSGKRIRPLLVYATGQAVGTDWPHLDPLAGAVELIHAYSLVHDDLPCMDDDELRRGRATCHIAYDEATALLAGDALQTLAFYVLAHAPLPVTAEIRLQMIKQLALSAGSRGMAGGQAIDLAAVGQPLNIAELENMHIHKTGALIRASVRLGALTQASITPERLKQLDHYAKCIGLAFQIQDDILDVEGETTALGKTQGKDSRQQKPTYPALLGLAEAKRKAGELHDEAIDQLAAFGQQADYLRQLAQLIIHRHH